MDDAECIDPNAGEEGFMIVRISTLSSNASTTTSSRVKEKIKSLRLIILSDDYVEVNEYITNITHPSLFENGNDEASEFIYTFRRNYVSGNKRIYVIANEESVEKVGFATGFTGLNGLDLPAGPSLSDILNLSEFQSVNLETDAADDNKYAPRFENILNAAYFLPVYTVIPDTNTSTDSSENSYTNNYGAAGTIYLPYSVYYDNKNFNEIKDKDGNVNGLTCDMYLVPAAAKFEFHFTNNRSNPVEVSELSVSSLSNLNFIMAQVYAPDDYKTLPGETQSLYWPDWLAKVAEKSWGSTSSGANQDFNNKYGWISRYYMPEGYSNSMMSFMSFVPENAAYTVPAPVTDTEGEIVYSGSLNLGPFYVPESLFMLSMKDENGNEISTPTGQRYALTFNLHDSSHPDHIKDVYFDKNIIENLCALFRDTHVIINVVMSEGETGVYAEINGWTSKEAFGFVGDTFL